MASYYYDYLPTPAVYRKLENYRQKGHMVNVKAITNPDKMYIYYNAAIGMGWDDLQKEIENLSWSRQGKIPVDENILKDIKENATVNQTLQDQRSEGEINLQKHYPKIAKALHGVPYEFKKRNPSRMECTPDYSNGRCWTCAYSIILEPPVQGVQPLEIRFANHTCEGGGTYGYVFEEFCERHSQKDLIMDIVATVKDYYETCGISDFHFGID